MNNLNLKSNMNRFGIAAMLFAIPMAEAFARRGGDGGGSIIGMILTLVAIIIITIVWNVIVTAAKGALYSMNTANTVSTKASGLTIQNKPWDEQKQIIGSKINNSGEIFAGLYGEEVWDKIITESIRESENPEYQDFPTTTLMLGLYTHITMLARVVMDQSSTTTAPASKSLYKSFEAIESLCATVGEGHVKTVIANLEKNKIKDTSTAYCA